MCNSRPNPTPNSDLDPNTNLVRELRAAARSTSPKVDSGKVDRRRPVLPSASHFADEFVAKRPKSATEHRSRSGEVRSGAQSRSRSGGADNVAMKEGDKGDY